MSIQITLKPLDTLFFRDDFYMTYLLITDFYYKSHLYPNLLIIDNLFSQIHNRVAV